MVANMLRPIDSVTPHKGVWIETPTEATAAFAAAVTPHKGVWIET